MNRSLIPRNLDNSRFVKGLPGCAKADSAVLLRRLGSDRCTFDCFACMRRGSMPDFAVPGSEKRPQRLKGSGILPGTESPGLGRNTHFVDRIEGIHHRVRALDREAEKGRDGNVKVVKALGRLSQTMEPVLRIMDGERTDQRPPELFLKHAERLFAFFAELHFDGSKRALRCIFVRKNFRCRFPLSRGRPSIAQCCSGRVSSFGIRTRCATSGFICAIMHTRAAYCQFDVNKPISRLTLLPARIRPSKGLAVDLRVAESTGLEPATSAVTGQRSNQLSYNSMSEEGEIRANYLDLQPEIFEPPAGLPGRHSCIRVRQLSRAADLSLRRCSLDRSALSRRVRPASFP